MFRYMSIFDKIENTLKKLGKFVFIFALVVGIIAIILGLVEYVRLFGGDVYYSDHDYMMSKALTPIFWGVLSCVSSIMGFPIYGLGVMIEETKAIRKKLYENI